jgi:predicted RNA-binding Zn-ribbon protein involved in translation (DUF1610 family)
MAIRNLNASDTGLTDDWQGNNAAFTCPLCRKVFIVSGRLHKQGRQCPECGKSTGFVKGGRKSKGTARIEWVISN